MGGSAVDQEGSGDKKTNGQAELMLGVVLGEGREWENEGREGRIRERETKREKRDEAGKVPLVPSGQGGGTYLKGKGAGDRDQK